jgi:MYXO-CTERM domain-containing protein
MRSSWPARLLPVFQALAEGGWLSVVYAALQVATGEQPRIGVLELAMLAGLGMAWARRRRWRTPTAEAAGLPLLALLGGAAGWFLDPAVRIALIDGHAAVAFGLHVPGWLAAVAVVRGGLHASPDDDEEVGDRLLRFGVPGLAAPWLLGSLASAGALRAAFTATAFVSTMAFAVGAFAALGMARLEDVRITTGSDWRRSRAWLALVAGISLASLLIGIPAAVLLGVPMAALAAAIFGPLRLLFLLLILATTPLIVLIAAATELLRPLLPKGITLPQIKLPNLGGDPLPASTPIPTIVVIVVVAVLALIELAVLALIIYLRWEERRRMAVGDADDFEERSIVIPPEEPPALPAALPRSRRRRNLGEPEGAYLAALDALQRDGRWARRASESPGAHARRVTAEGLAGAAFGRLALAYQLVRYGGRRLPERERRRSRRRLEALRRHLGR